jgi:hypothetical protein
MTPLMPDRGPSWLRPLVDNVGHVPDAYRRRLPADVLNGIVAGRAAAKTTANAPASGWGSARRRCSPRKRGEEESGNRKRWGGAALVTPVGDEGDA